MKNYHWFILLTLSLFVGLLIGHNLSLGFLKIKADGIGLDQLLSILVTLGIGWYIPSKLAKIIEDKRVIKNLLVEEVHSFLTFVKAIKNKVNKCFTDGAITSNDKLEINLLFEEADLLVANLKSQAEIVNAELCDNPIAAYTDYWRFVTGGSLMNQNYIAIDPAFNSKIIVEHYKFEIAFKQLAQVIQTSD